MTIGLDLITKANQALDLIAEIGPRKVSIPGISTARMYNFLKDRDRVKEASLGNLLSLVAFYNLRVAKSIEDSRRFYQTQQALNQAFSKVQTDDEDAKKILDYLDNKLTQADSQLLTDLLAEIRLNGESTAN